MSFGPTQEAGSLFFDISRIPFLLPAYGSCGSTRAGLEAGRRVPGWSSWRLLQGLRDLAGRLVVQQVWHLPGRLMQRERDLINFRVGWSFSRRLVCPVEAASAGILEVNAMH